MNNMKTTLSLIITATAVSIASAQEPTDTVKTKDLKEVVVEAQMQKTSSNVTTYYPDKNSKRTAQNAIDLLDRMAIPQFKVNPADGSVATPSGDSVAIYIDMEQATQEE